MPTKTQILDRFWSINIGQIITVVIFVGGIIATWKEMGAQLAQVDYRVTQVEHAIADQRATSTTLATVVVELRLTREQLSDLRGDIRRMELSQAGVKHREITK